MMSPFTLICRDEADILQVSLEFYNVILLNFHKKNFHEKLAFLQQFYFLRNCQYSKLANLIYNLRAVSFNYNNSIYAP